MKIIDLKNLFVVLFALSLAAPGFSNDTGMKPTKYTIRDGEFLKYSIVRNGKKFGNFYIVNTFISNKNIIKTYMYLQRENTKVIMPEHYTNYNSIMMISNGSIRYFLDDSLSNSIKDNIKGPVFGEMTIDDKILTAFYRLKTWDGAQVEESKSRVAISTDIPLWNWNEIMFLACRYLDMKAGGTIGFFVPLYVKGFFKGRFFRVKDEILATEAGRFDTTKYGYSMGDYLLGMLMSIYTKDYYFWMDNKTGIMIRMTGSGKASATLEKAGVWPVY